MKLLTLISGGIDSPVALDLFVKKGIPCESVIFEMEPFSTEEQKDTAIRTVQKIASVRNRTIPVTIFPHGFVQQTFLESIPRKFVNWSCLFSRRLMLKTAEELAKEKTCNAIVTGESLGQVASQTLANILVTDKATHCNILRPVLFWDKEEIIAHARSIGTFDISAGGGIQCAAHVDFPQTKATIETMEKIESSFDLPSLIKQALRDRTELTCLPEKHP